jgi:RNA polymerase sigma factor (sigma-70 family)
MTADGSGLPDVTRLLEDGAWLRALARSVVADAAAADDVAQDAAVVALTRPPREAGALRGWLRRVVKNLATDRHRSAVRRGALEEACARREAGDDAADLVARWEIRRQVVDAVLALDEPYRATLLLRFFEGLDLADVAARQCVPLDTVKSRQRRALDMLRARLAHLDDGAGRRGFAVLLVLARPGEGATNAGAASAASAVLGGIAMSALTKSLVAGIVVAALAGAWWLARDDVRDVNAAGAKALADATAERAQRPARHGAPAAVAPAAVPDSPAADAAYDADRDVRGVVVDRDDRPVKDAHVTAHPFDLLRWTLAAARGVSDGAGEAVADSHSAADGTFLMRLTPGRQTLLRVAAAGLADVEAPYVQAGQTLRIVLDPPTTLRVRVEDAGGTPVAGASVLARPVWRQGETTRWTRCSTTGADGVVSWDGLPRGRSQRVEIDVSPPPGRAPATANCELEDRELNETVVTLAAGRTVEGRVLDAETGIGVAGARLHADIRRPAVAVTRSDGSFRIDGWTAVPRWSADPMNRLAVLADGYSPAWADVPEAKDTKAFTVTLRRGFDVTGTVVDPDGRPVADAQIGAVAADRNGASESFLDTATDAAGAFRLGWFPLFASTFVSVTARDGARAAVAVPAAQTGQTTVDLGTIRVAPGRTVRGRVVDASGAPKQSVFVRLLDAKDEPPSLAPFRTVNDDGRFAFADVSAGRRRITVASTGPDGAETALDIDVPADADPPAVTITVGAAPAKPPAKVTLATRVIDEDGQPVAGAQFGVGYGSGGWTGIVTAGADGSLDVACADEPEYISTRFDGEFAQRWLYSFVWLRPGARTASVVLKRASPISGTVTDAEGKPLGGAWVEAVIGSRQVGSGSADAAGRFSFGVPPGSTVDLEAQPTGQQYPPPPDVGERRGVAAGATDVMIRVAHVEMGRALDVVLVLPEGLTAGKCEVMANFHGLDNRNGAVFRKTFDAAGRVRIEGLPHAPVSLRVLVRLAGEDEKSFAGASQVRVDAEATSVRVVVPGFRIVRGRVVDEAGAPSPGASIFSTAASNASGTVADATGAFALRVPSDAAAPFLVTATKTPYDRKAPFGGWDIVEDESGRELSIVLKAQPAR